MRIAIRLEGAAHRFAFLRLKYSAVLAGERVPVGPVRVMGLSFPGRIGAAAGLDRYGELTHLAHRLGLGFVETGTVTPQPEPGTNRGLDALLANLSRHDRHRLRCRVGISIAANSATSLEETWRDLCACMERAWDHADYFTLNLGSRIAALARDRVTLGSLLQRVKNAQRALAHERYRHVPVIMKLAMVDDPAAETVTMVDALCAAEFDGVLVAITGGAPGDGVRLTGKISELAGDRLAIVSVGGIRSPHEAGARVEAGAALLQMHRGLLWPGAHLVDVINEAIATRPAL
jgi:dihydroorotate dehydrogenase